MGFLPELITMIVAWLSSWNKGVFNDGAIAFHKSKAGIITDL